MPRTRLLAVVAALAALGALPALGQDRDPAEVTRPAGTTPFQAPPAELEALGATLFKDPSLSTNSMSCDTCHAGFGAYNDGFATPYPHAVGMAEGMFGLASVDAEQMVQLCMVVPMAAPPLAWDSPELAALTAYVLTEQAAFAMRPASP